MLRLVRTRENMVFYAATESLITRGVGSPLNNAETAICHSLMIPGFRILGEAAPATQQSR